MTELVYLVCMLVGFSIMYIFSTCIVRKYLRMPTKRCKVIRVLYKARVIMLFAFLTDLFISSIVDLGAIFDHITTIPLLLSLTGILVCSYAIKDESNRKNEKGDMGLFLFSLMSLLLVDNTEQSLIPQTLSPELRGFLSIIVILVIGRIHLSVIGASEWQTSLFLNGSRLVVVVLAAIGKYEKIPILKHKDYINESVVASLVVDSIIKSLLERKKKTSTNILLPQFQRIEAPIFEKNSFNSNRKRDMDERKKKRKKARKR